MKMADGSTLNSQHTPKLARCAHTDYQRQAGSQLLYQTLHTLDAGHLSRHDTQQRRTCWARAQMLGGVVFVQYLCILALLAPGHTERTID
jgi:hypothetical protein